MFCFYIFTSYSNVFVLDFTSYFLLNYLRSFLSMNPTPCTKSSFPSKYGFNFEPTCFFLSSSNFFLWISLLLKTSILTLKNWDITLIAFYTLYFCLPLKYYIFSSIFSFLCSIRSLSISLNTLKPFKYFYINIAFYCIFIYF